ncbi:MAG: hypothetical protein WCQ30_00760 [Bacteroidales bacterium]
MKSISFKIILILFIFLSCNTNKLNNIKGYWTSENSPTVDFIIIDDKKIWYFESPDTNLYKIHKDTFYLYDKDYLIGSYLIKKLTNDSLILETEDGTIIREYKVE